MATQENTYIAIAQNLTYVSGQIHKLNGNFYLLSNRFKNQLSWTKSTNWIPEKDDFGKLEISQNKKL